MTLSGWVEKYGKITGYTTAVVIVTVFFVRFDAKFSAGNTKLEELNSRLSDMATQVEQLKILVSDRERYERWNRGYNARLKRLFNRNGWEYDEVE